MVLDENVVLRPLDAISGLIGTDLNSFLTILVSRQQGLLRFYVADLGGAPHQRVLDTIVYLRHRHAIASQDDHAAAHDAPSFIFQTDDNPVNAVSGSWEQRRVWSSITLVPDIYYYQARGYEDFLPEAVPWDERDDQLLWRGSTTGMLGLSAARLDELPRYRLCRIADQLGNAADCAFTNVVQGITPEDDHLVQARLIQENLLRPFIQPHEMQRARYAIDIDGNANSWNFIQRLRLGACMLRVESPWFQWFEDRLLPWQHYVPVAGDLSNLAERLEWCRANPAAARDIAAAGRDFALRMSFGEELLKAARATFPPYR